VFRDDWLACLVVESAPELHGIAGSAVAVLLDAPDMHDTMQAMLDTDANVSAAARRLGLHPNTVTYRLSRFAKQTGLDPRTTTGLLAVRLALTLTRANAPG
jgi:DNA-binding PucR family transcriptional regulator